MGVAWNTRWRDDMHAGFLLENVKGKDCLADLGMDGKIIL
jgi:hypothetical protein